MLLIIIIYITFISLGLPDALLGSSWTLMRAELNAPVEIAGVISMVIASGTIVSSLMTSRLLRRFRTETVVVVSVAMTALALCGFSWSEGLLGLLFWAIPLGLGGGAVDATLNNFVALHYKSRHMNWLHSFWGVGAMAGPLLLSFIFLNDGSWRDGYLSVGLIQTALVVLLLVSLPLWRGLRKTPPLVSAESTEPTCDGDLSQSAEPAEHTFISNRTAFGLPGVKISLIAFFCYCGLEAGAGLWAATYLTTQKGVVPADAALWTSLYYGGITVGRFLTGMISDKVGSESLIRYGIWSIIVGVVTLFLPLPAIFSLVGLMLIGLGCAPIYPAMIHLTPSRFGTQASQAILGLSMACAYMGSTAMPPVIGALSGAFGFQLMPYVLLALALTMYISSEVVRGRGCINL